MSATHHRERIRLGITTRNRATLLPRAIGSARAQRGIELSVAVHDDASTDGTPAIADRFPMVEWTRSDPSIGYRESRTRWMQREDADYFVSLDDDAWFLTGDEIALALSRFRADPFLAAVAFDILSPERPRPVERGSPRPVSLFIGCGHMVRLSAIRAVGGYAPAPGPYGSEEKDLCLRLMDAGFRVELLPGVHVWHEKAWLGRDHAGIHRSGVCNELGMTLRRCPAPELWLVLPWKLVSFARFWLRHPRLARAGCAGVTDTIRFGPSFWRTRRPVRREVFWRFHRSR